ncbi:MAG: FAD-dependent oxidoreductase [Alphaproteobacteria bacterium]
MSDTTETVLIAGGGIAGMCCALALSAKGFDVTVLERDVAPPAGDADKAFFEWQRRGASQFRHPHAFLGLMCNLLQDHYPDLLDDFYAAGARRIGFTDMLPPALLNQYTPTPEDDRLWVLMCRRATIETVLRRYLEKQPAITFHNGAIIENILTHSDGEGLSATGVQLRKDSAEQLGFREITADVIVDASGRTTKFPQWLAAHDITIEKEDHDAELLYYTRHYKFKPGIDEPKTSGNKDRNAGDLGYIKFGIFPGDNGHFALILCLHKTETDLIEAIKDGDQFDRIARSIPGLAPWVDAAKAEPTTHPFGMADIRAVWRHYVDDDKPLVRNFFAVGDAMVRTNPLYGRGCSTSILHAHMLADVLQAQTDPIARALLFDRRSEDELRPIYKTSLTEDRNNIRRALHYTHPGKVKDLPGWQKKFAAAFFDALAAAVTNNIHVFRGAMRSLNLLEKPGAFLTDWRTRLIVFRYMLRGRSKNAGVRTVRGPTRQEMLQLITTT